MVKISNGPEKRLIKKTQKAEREKILTKVTELEDEIEWGAGPVGASNVSKE